MSTDIEATKPGNDDEYHLDLLGTLHWVLAGIAAVAGLFPILHITIGFIVIVASVAGEGAEPGSRGMGVLMGVMFIGIGTAIIVMSWVVAYCLYLSGKYLKAHTNHTFCMVIAVLICFSFPLGTALGVFTILVLIRPSVRQMFGVA